MTKSKELSQLCNEAFYTEGEYIKFDKEKVKIISKKKHLVNDYGFITKTHSNGYTTMVDGDTKVFIPSRYVTGVKDV